VLIDSYLSLNHLTGDTLILDYSGIDEEWGDIVWKILIIIEL
jgi:translation initiation factor IF-1